MDKRFGVEKFGVEEFRQFLEEKHKVFIYIDREHLEEWVLYILGTMDAGINSEEIKNAVKKACDYYDIP